MARKFAAVVFSLGCVQASPLMALGLGEITLGSYLNEPLKAQVDLLNVGGLHEDQIKIRLATTDDFKRMGVDRAYFLTSITFDVEIDDNGRSRIVITSEDPVLEPYLDFIVEARWPSGRLLREYTVLVDPPVFDQSNPVISASQRVSEVDGEPEPAKKKQEVVATTGTRVDVRQSRLAPGEMPQRGFNADTSPSPVPGTRYMIHRDDTLWHIASRARPGSTSVHQTMLDIQRLNPNAFIDGNINRIKAGYIIYLPNEGDISSGDYSAAQAEVREQNKAWREGRSLADAATRPSLRISAEPEEAAAGAATGGGVQRDVAATAAALEDAEKAGLAQLELEQRLSAMEQQVETLQRIVSLKDDQIAALQGVLAGNEEADAALPVAAVEELEALEGEVGLTGGASADGASSTDAIDAGDAAATIDAIDTTGDTSSDTAGDVTGDAAGMDAAGAEAEELVTGVEEIASEEPAPAMPAPAADAAESGGIMSYLWYIVGAVVLAVLGFVFMRRRRDEEDDFTAVAAAAPVQDAFADVELTEQPLDLEEQLEQAPEEVVAAPEPRKDTSRGYGQRKHDEYASDVESNDALAEADIYIAYGRYPQAIDLLKNALANEPDNAAYRLKLLQLYVETGNTAAAKQQLVELEAIGDAESLAVARDAMAGGGRGAAAAPAQGFAAGTAAVEEDLLGDIDDGALEADFSGLEIEEPGTGTNLDDELDLSADFDDDRLTSDSLDEDLVIAADSNGLSTKLDLARAYMDMGDDDGARQILEEVAAEGNEELQAEARALLERIG